MTVAKPALDIALVFGKGKKGPKPTMGAMAPEPDADEGMGMGEGDMDGDEELPPEFVSAAEEAFPDLAGDAVRLAALKRMIEACY